jgi:NAD(P)-dependent dehydrogenase (short-subunit alcohol dehydrogenase family)
MTTYRQLADMKNRRVLVTGGAGHLGKIMANTLAELGASIILLDRPGTNFTEIIKQIKSTWGVECISIECDLESEDHREIAIHRIKSDELGLNVLINNAALSGMSVLDGWNTSFEQQSLDTWRKAMEVNLTAAFHLSKALAPELTAARGGNIVNISSIYGELGPDWRFYDGTSMGNPAAYSVSKGGIVQLTRWLATTLAPKIRVNAIAPGGICRSQNPAFMARYIDRTPLGRMATEDDFRGAIGLLASDLSKYITGQIIGVDGGYAAW